MQFLIFFINGNPTPYPTRYFESNRVHEEALGGGSRTAARACLLVWQRGAPVSSKDGGGGGAYGRQGGLYGALISSGIGGMSVRSLNAGSGSAVVPTGPFLEGS
jgi:hypothetical protein